MVIITSVNKLVVAALIKNPEGQVLAVHLNKEKPEGVWVMPGGKLEDGESARDCVVREAKEELGIDIHPLKLAGICEVDYPSGSWVFLYYQSEIVSGTPTPREEGKTLEAKYIDPQELHEYQKIVWF